MLKKFLFAAAAEVTFAALVSAAPAMAQPWTNYDGYNVVPPVVYAVPFGYPVIAYTEATVAVPVVIYAPMRVRIYDIPQQPPYYNVPPYPVFVPY